MGRSFFFLSLWWGIHVKVLKTLAALALKGCSDEQGFKAFAAVWLVSAQIEGRLRNMTVYREKIEGGSVIRIQTCKETITLQIETPLNPDTLHISVSTLLEINDAKVLQKILKAAIKEME